METEQYVLWRGKDTLIPKEKLSAVYSHVTETYTKTPEGLYTSYYAKSDDRLEMKLLSDEYVCIMESICTHLNVKMDGFRYWTQIYDGSHDIHDHGGFPTAVCFTHFIEPIGSFFYFVGPNNKKIYPKQEKGDIIAFHPAQLHGIDASYCNKRMTIAGNILSYGN